MPPLMPDEDKNFGVSFRLKKEMTSPKKIYSWGALSRNQKIIRELFNV